MSFFPEAVSRPRYGFLIRIMAAVAQSPPIQAHLQAFLATFDAGSKRQGEKNKCMTVLKSSFFKYVSDKLIADTAFAMEEHRKMKAVLESAFARENSMMESRFAEGKSISQRYKEWEDEMDKLNKIVEEYQLKSISLMSRQEHLKVEAENALMKDELKKLHQKCWDFDACVSKECQRLKINQKSGRKRKPENKPHFNP